LQQGNRQWALAIAIKEIKKLREAGFEQALELLNELGALVDGLAAVFAQCRQFAGLLLVGLPDREKVMEVFHHLGQQAAVPGIVLGSPSAKGVPQLSGDFAVERVERQISAVSHQRVEKRPAGFFHRHADAPSTAIRAEKLGYPFVESLGGVFDLSGCALVRAGLQQADVVFGVSPVDPHIDGVGLDRGGVT